MGVGPRRNAFLGSSGHPSGDLNITEPTTPFALRNPSTWTRNVQPGVALGGLASCAALPGPEAGAISESTIARCARHVSTKLGRCRRVQGSSGTTQLMACKSRRPSGLDGQKDRLIAMRSGSAKFFPQDSPVAIAPRQLAGFVLEPGLGKNSGPMCGEAHRTRVKVSSDRVRRVRRHQREQSLCAPGSNRGKTPDDRHAVRRVQLWADRSRNRSRVFPVPEPNGSQTLHHLGRFSLPCGKACNASA